LDLVGGDDLAKWLDSGCVHQTVCLPSRLALTCFS
jgi:hypothetical protein